VVGEAIYKCYKKIKIDAKKVDEKKANREEQKKSSLYQWLNKYSVNISKMDGQHKKLVSLINYFYTAKKEKKEQAVLKASLNYLLSYTKTHFSHEEKLLEEHSYPDLIPHKAIHKDFTDSLLDMEKRFKGGDMDVANELSLLLLEWLFDHISKEDKKYGKYLNSISIT
jgi:hemerythrin-like metal-binding protein